MAAKIAQDGAKMSQNGPMMNQEAGSKMDQDGLKIPQDGSKISQDGHFNLRVGLNGSSEASSRFPAVCSPKSRPSLLPINIIEVMFLA